MSTEKSSNWLGEMMSERARQYAQVHAQEAQTLLARNGLEWYDGNMESLRDILQRNGLELVMDQTDVSEQPLGTKKHYTLKLCRIIDTENYTIAFHLKMPEEGDKK